jgi:membrane-associated protease RseP (regulator of RpoE activity)
MTTRKARWVGIALAAVLMLLLFSSIALAADEQAEAGQGALILSVTADSPADAAGLVRGDIILAMDDESIESSADLAARILAAAPGDIVALTVRHGDDQYAVDVELGDKAGRAYLGVYLATDIIAQPAPKTRSWRLPPHAYGMMPYTDTASGALVFQVAEGSPAEEAGIETGDVILGVEGERLAQAYDLADRIGEYEPGAEVTLEILRRNGTKEDVIVVLGAHPEDAEKAFLGIQYLPTPRRMFLGRSPEGDLLVPPIPYFHHGPYFFGPRPWGPHSPQPRSHRWLPYGFPMPHDCDGDRPWWGCDDDGDESDEPFDQPESEELPDAGGNDNAGFPAHPVLPSVGWQRL